MVTLSNFWRGRKVLVTGHTGFKGAWLAFWLRELGAEVHGFALDPPTDPNLFDLAQIRTVMTSDTRGDVRKIDELHHTLMRFRPEIVFHLAAQSLVRLSYAAPVETFDVNVMGTVSLLTAIRKVPSIGAVVVVTTDKCYENNGAGLAYCETDPLGGADPYSASKACAEIVTASFRTSNRALADGYVDALIASVRSGNVIGGGDWSSDRLVPDCIRSFMAQKPVVLRYPHAVRPWLHVLEPLAGYLTLAERLMQPGAQRYAEAFNFGPRPENEADVITVAQAAAVSWGSGAYIETTDGSHLPESAALRLDATKARKMLDWDTRWNLQQSIENTVQWYRAWHEGRNVQQLMARQLADFSTTKAA